MKTPVRIVFALVLSIGLLAAAGIAGATPTDRADPTDPGDTATSSPIASDPVDPTIAWDDPANAQPVVPRSGMADVRARPFDRAIVNDDGSVTLLFTSGIEPCAVLDHVVVDLGADTATFTLFEGRDASAGNVACIEIGVLKSVTIPLDEPLAGRRIVDGAA